jgi:NADH dehydrogenase
VPHVVYAPHANPHASFWGRIATSSITQPPMHGHAIAELVRRGVEVRERARVTNVDRAGVQLGDERIDGETVLWAAGVASSPLGSSLGAPLDRAGRVDVDVTLALPGHPEVFVIGDLALVRDDDGQPLPGVAAVAMQEGAYVARTIRDIVAGRPPQRFKYRDPGTMATIGRGAAIADLPHLQLTGFPGWLAWLLVHIVKLIGFRNRFIVLSQWAWSFFTLQRSVRLITSPYSPPSSRTDSRM